LTIYTSAEPTPDTIVEYFPNLRDAPMGQIDAAFKAVVRESMTNEGITFTYS